MKPGKPLQRRTPLHPVTRNADKRKRDRSRKWGAAAFNAFLRDRGCVLARVWPWHVKDCAPPLDICHLQSRGAGGGEFDSIGRDNLLPMCRRMHQAQEGRTAKFNQQNSVDLWALAADEKRAWEATR